MLYTKRVNKSKFVCFSESELTLSAGAPRIEASATAKLAPREKLAPGLSAGGIPFGMDMNSAI